MRSQKALFDGLSEEVAGSFGIKKDETTLCLIVFLKVVYGGVIPHWTAEEEPPWAPLVVWWVMWVIVWYAGLGKRVVFRETQKLGWNTSRLTSPGFFRDPPDFNQSVEWLNPWVGKPHFVTLTDAHVHNWHAWSVARIENHVQAARFCVVGCHKGLSRFLHTCLKAAALGCRAVAGLVCLDLSGETSQGKSGRQVSISQLQRIISFCWLSKAQWIMNDVST